MVHWREFEFSSELFGGFRCRVDLDECDTLDDVVRSAVAALQRSLERLPQLARRAEAASFAIHTVSLAELLLSQGGKNYICEGCACSE